AGHVYAADGVAGLLTFELLFFAPEGVVGGADGAEVDGGGVIGGAHGLEDGLEMGGVLIL
ncbi:MAG: hypothetical protein ACK2UG_10940, partial [Candidatus Promineifilaceae bacterium]